MHAMNRLLTLAHSKAGPNRRYRRWKFSICGCQYYQLYFARSRDCGYWSSLGKSWNSSHLPKECYITDNIPEDLSFDHAFECCGGDGTGPAINDLVRYIRPQGNDSYDGS